MADTTLRPAKGAQAICDHGNLRRKCELCERDKRIHELEDAIRTIAARWDHGDLASAVRDAVDLL